RLPPPSGGLALSRLHHGGPRETPGGPSVARQPDRGLLPFASPDALVHPREFLDGRDDALDLGRADPRVDWELEEAGDDFLCDGTSTADLQVPQRLLLVQRHGIRRPAADSVLVQVLDDFVPGPRERLFPADDVLVIRMDHPVPFGRRDEALDAIEAFRERAGVRPSLLHPVVVLRDLLDT